MDEISAVHEITLEWGSITHLIDKIGNIEDSIPGGWPELIDMIGDAIAQEDGEKDPEALFFNLYHFLFRLYYRLKTKPHPEKFNKYSKHGEYYWITNYNYEAFKWARQNGWGEEIDNSIIKIPSEKIPEKTKLAIERRCE